MTNKLPFSVELNLAAKTYHELTVAANYFKGAHEFPPEVRKSIVASLVRAQVTRRAILAQLSEKIMGDEEYDASKMGSDSPDRGGNPNDHRVPGGRS